MTTTQVSAPVVTRVSLVAPITGVLVPIEQVPDPVFAQKMVGEGISIDPLSNVLVAPCDGEVIHLHPAKHALTIRSAEGLEVLTHIGLDTVHMKGEGFTVKVKVGDQVGAGVELITFDLDAVATNAKSLLTQMVIANSDVLADFEARSGVVTAGRDVVAVATLAAVEEAAEGAPRAAGRKVTSDAILVPNPVGLHARPAAVLSNLASQYESDISLKRGEDQANAKSVMAIMGMEVRYGDKVRVAAYGPDAEAAVADLAAQIAVGLGEEGVVPIAEAGVEPAAPVPAAPPVAPAPRPPSGDPHVVFGVAA
jgi:phosphocarrier protein FPr